MNKQISFNYKFVNDHNEHNYFVNATNVDAFNGLFNFDNNLFFLYGPKKSGKSYLSQIWLKKNNAIEFKNNFEEFGLPPLYKENNWEEFLWRGKPFGFHIRRFNKKNRVVEKELELVDKVIDLISDENF